jgi:hypothetical protein
MCVCVRERDRERETDRQTTDDRGQTTDDRRQTTEDRGQTTDEQTTDDRRQTDRQTTDKDRKKTKKETYLLILRIGYSFHIVIEHRAEFRVSETLFKTISFISCRLYPLSLWCTHTVLYDSKRKKENKKRKKERKKAKGNYTKKST